MNLRLSNPVDSRTKNKIMLYLHQCKQCGVLFEHIEKTYDYLGEFSWNRKFMVDKCDTCKNFRVFNVYN